MIVTAVALRLRTRSQSLDRRTLARIRHIQQEVAGIATYDLAFEDPQRGAGVPLPPGQFNMLYLPGFGESAISISSDPGSSTGRWATRSAWRAT